MPLVEYRPFRDEDWERLRYLVVEAFRRPPTRSDWLKSGRVVAVDGTTQAATRVRYLRQFFGGRSVAVGGLSAMLVAPEGRGRRFGSLLLREALRELRHRGAHLATAYVTTQRFYRSLGYEVAGARTTYGASVASLPPSDGAGLQAWGDDQLSDVDVCYQSLAKETNGLLSRSKAYWRNSVLKEARGVPVYKYLVRDGTKVGGYVVYDQEPEPAPLSIDSPYSIRCRDLVWTSERSVTALLAFLSGQRTLGRDVIWTGPVEEPLELFLERQTLRILRRDNWVARVINVAAALEARGYPRAIETTVEFNVTDSLFPENAGPIRLEVTRGSGAVSPGTIGRPTLDVGILGSLFTGWLRARDAARAGRIQGASAAQLEALESVFSGPKPWLLDHY
jgi:predicted acetyltransferase